MIFRKSGILGINARNLLYIRPYNRRKAIKLADDKLKTKQFLSAREIPVPRLYATIKHGSEIEKFDFNTLPNSFVIKPNKGFGGEGIIPIIRREEDKFITAGGKKLTLSDLKEHLQDIVDGRFSISNVADYAFMEQFIVADERIGKFSYEGLPDIRVVVHNLIPIMAMLRLPTRESEGKANLHLGAVGVGIDIAKGEATHIAYKNKIIDELPDGLGKIRGLEIPYWDQILEIASKVQLITNLGYMAIDICLDKNIGPVLLEINARAGLGVQVANLAPLRKRLERIEGIKVTTPAKGVRIAKDMFGNVVEKEIKSLSGKQIIGLHEDVAIIQKEGTLRIKSKVDTGKNISVIDQELALQAGLLDDQNNYDDEKSTLKIKLSIKGQRIQTIVNVEKIPDEKHKIIIGKRDLSHFFIDPTIVEKEKKEVVPSIEKKPSNKAEINFREVDQELIALDSKIKLLYHLRPINLEEEKAKFFLKNDYNPQFEYPQLKFNPLELSDKLGKIKLDQSALGTLFEKKRIEIENKIKLLESIDEENFSKYSILLFGQPNEEEVRNCQELILKEREEAAKEEELDAEYAKGEFEKVFEYYGLEEWKVKLKDSMVADCVAGKNNRLFIRKDAKFTKKRIQSLIVHEIETHIITAANGKKQDYEIFQRGLGDYLITQEGMAMYNVEQQIGDNFADNTKAMGHVLGINKAMSSSFLETFEYLTQEYHLDSEQAFRSCLKAKRGFCDTSKPGSFTKDYIYYKGYHQVKNYIEKGGNLADLYIGKLNLIDLETAKMIPGIKKPSLLPKWLNK